MERKLVIDISHWDGDIDLKAWRDKRGLWGVVIKAGGREAHLGRYTTSTFERHYKKAKEAGLHVGAYYYTITTDVANAKKDAEHFAAHLVGKKFDMPVYMDVEDAGQFKLTTRGLTDVIKAFCDVLDKKGYKAGIYTGGSAWLNEVYRSELFKYADWIAWWRSKWPTEAGEIGMWQQGGMRLSDGDIHYGDKQGYTDVDWCVVDYPAMLSGAKIVEERSDKGTVEAVMREAYADLGYYAPNDPEQGSKAGRYCAALMKQPWMAGPSTSIWWCCMWVSMIMDKAGVKCPGFPSQNTDVAYNGGARKNEVAKSNIKRGDILIFDWNFATTSTDHIGFATASPSNGCVKTIEGNVGNAVKEKVRPLSSIRYVIRPSYAASYETEVIRPNGPSQNGKKLDVDGYAGYNTIFELQTQLGTYADGIVSGQIRRNYEYFENVVSVSFGGEGSAMVKAMQAKVGAEVDGYWGSATSAKVQDWLSKQGYECKADGYFGPESVKALQRSLNDGKWS